MMEKRGLGSCSWFAAFVVALCVPSTPLAAISRQDFPRSVDLNLPSGAVAEGGVFFVSLSSTDELKDVAGDFQGRSVQFYPDHDTQSGVRRFTAIVGVEYGSAVGRSDMTLRGTIVDREFERKAKVMVKPGIFPSEALRVPPRTIAPTPRDREQIARDRVLLSRTYATKTARRLWDPPAVLPIRSDITSVFGTTRVYNGKKHNVHLGTDLRAPTPTPVLAPLSGRVAVARHLFYTGYTAIIDHGFGLFTIYGHLSELRVRENVRVKKGAVLGLSGATGRVSGPHLHWGVNLHGVKVDPMVLVRALK